MNLEEMTAGLLGTLEMQTAQTAAAISALEPLMERMSRSLTNLCRNWP